MPFSVDGVDEWCVPWVHGTCIFKHSVFRFIKKVVFSSQKLFTFPIKTIGSPDSVYPVSFECGVQKHYRRVHFGAGIMLKKLFSKNFFFSEKVEKMVIFFFSDAVEARTSPNRPRRPEKKNLFFTRNSRTVHAFSNIPFFDSCHGALIHAFLDSSKKWFF